MRASAVAGIIFANSHDEALHRLTEKRSMASVPFGGRYRLVDFALSNFVNAGITNVGVITKENYRSLMDHIGSGIFWDLDRKTGGIRILPPYNVRGAGRYHGYVEALMGAMDFIKRCNADYIVISESGVAANIDISAAVDFHVNKNADVTIVYHHGTSPDDYDNPMILTVNGENRVTELKFPVTPESDVDYSIGVMIFTRLKLIELIKEAYSKESTSISRDILATKLSALGIYGFSHNGFAAVMDSVSSYYQANMSLLNSDVRNDLFNKDRPVFTKTRDDMPTRYGTKSNVKNSYIADGCVIDGNVKNSILFRGVTVEKGATVENCILMQGVIVSAGADIAYLISDKNAVIGADTTIKGTAQKTFIVKKNQIL